MENKLLYFSDPMCSWCYGLKPELEKLIGHFQNDFEIEIVMGGLRPGGGDTWNDEFKLRLRSHWDRVQLTSGQPFTFKLLEAAEFHYDTEPACRAVCVVKQIRPDIVYPFFNAVQHMFYAEGEDPTKEDFYVPILNSLNIDHREFFGLFRSEEGYMLAENDFQKTAEYKVSGFPTILMESGDQVYRVSYGYSTFQTMKDRVMALMIQN